jgi:hypothetical protein
MYTDEVSIILNLPPLIGEGTGSVEKKNPLNL